ncbi:PREDICTED: placenta-specific protein 9 [Gekko japonicus]|uniref:Placenta-specific protein 9 n=1 Tax=Gekko japonicus TaxID=146911 RepID=A0ABM1KX14_GEKJA|nr:PREDICTED: placenta-specific protein 9 [Gekko japonicus]
MFSTWALLFLLMLSKPALVAADPVRIDPQGHPERNDWCDNHNTIHRRLENIQEKVEKTVDHLESEVKSLLSAVSETAWNVPLAPETPLLDIFEDPS